MTTITATSTVGLYISQEQNGQIAANTPGGIDLAALVNGDSYVYCDTVLSFDHRLNFMYTDAFKGHKTLHSYTAGGTGSTTGEGESEIFMVSLEMTNANAFLWKKFSRLNNRTGDGNKYLIHQYAANTFEPFPNYAGTSKYYSQVAVLDIDVLEVNGKLDVKRVTITLQGVQNP